jgi:hypothetical protein
MVSRDNEDITPEARSPFLSSYSPTREIFRENIGTGTPIAGHNYSLAITIPKAVACMLPTLL